MHRLVVWSLLTPFVGLTFVTASDSCNSYRYTMLQNCEQISGHIIECNDQTLEHLQVFSQCTESIIALAKHRTDYSAYSEMKLYDKLKIRMLLALNNLSSLRKKAPQEYRYDPGTYCINAKTVDWIISGWKMENTSALEWLEYYFPIIAGLELVFGMMGNMLIVLIYIHHPAMRTGPNMVIMNLAVGDILLLNSNILIYYISYRWIPQHVAVTLCHIVIYFRTLAIALSVYSMVVLSMLRLSATVSTPGSTTQHWLEKRVTVPMILLLVWVLAGVTGIPEYISYDSMNSCEFSDKPLAVCTRLACLCVLPLAAIFGFSVATSRILRKSVRQLPGELIPEVLRERRARQIGAKVILCLAVVFCITHLPLSIYYTFNLFYEYHPVMNFFYFYTVSAYHYTFSVQLFIPLNSCLNPVALFIGSRKYCQCFKYYLSRCFRKDANSLPND